MGKKYLIDSNALIDFSGKILPLQAEKRLGVIIDDTFNISFISKIEVLGHISANSRMVDFINTANIYTVDNPIIRKTIDLRKKHKIKLPDAIIAATALTHNFTLITRNLKDFQNIADLDLINPYVL